VYVGGGGGSQAGMRSSWRSFLPLLFYFLFLLSRLRTIPVNRDDVIFVSQFVRFCLLLSDCSLLFVFCVLTITFVLIDEFVVLSRLLDCLFLGRIGTISL